MPKRNDSYKNRGSRNPFLFVGNQLCLDLLNTRPVIAGKPVELLCDVESLLKWFEAADLLDHSARVRLLDKWKRSPAANATLQAIREFRETLRMNVLLWEQGKNIRPAVVQRCNGLMARHPMRARLSFLNASVVTTTWFEVSVPEDLFAPLARSAAELFSSADRSRLRKCANCVLHFLDTSKKGTRRWCSMKLCGNRFKVAAYSARKRRRNRTSY